MAPGLAARDESPPPFADAGAARACWIELHDLITDVPLPKEPPRSGRHGHSCLEARLSKYRAPLLEGVIRGAGALPRNLGTLSAEERGIIDEVREECRALLRGAVFVGDATVDLAIEALRTHAAAAIERGMARDGRRRRRRGRRGACRVRWNARGDPSRDERAAKPLARSRACAPLSSALTTLPAPAAQMASNLMASGEGLGRALHFARSSYLLARSPRALAEPTRGITEVSSVLPIALASLHVPEEEPTGAWPLRSKQEHAGSVAVMKLCSACPSVVIQAASSLPQLLSALHSATSQPPGALRGLSVRSAALLLVAATDLVAYTCNHHANSQTNPTELATALLGPPLGLTQQAATGSTGDAPLDEASRAASRLASILPRLPKTLQAAAAELMMPWSAALIHLLGLPVTEHEEASAVLHARR